MQLIPKLATIAKELIVFQRTPNYVLPGRNYLIDEYHRDEIKVQYANKWEHASGHPFGLAMYSTGKTMDNASETEIKSILDCGWEAGGFHYQFETFDDLFTNQRSNDIASDYLRAKIWAIVKDPAKAELLTPKYAFLSKRPPCGHHVSHHVISCSVNCFAASFMNSRGLCGRINTIACSCTIQTTQELTIFNIVLRNV